MDEPIIKCPVCGAEYLPAEIYLPDNFLGKPTEIVRDSLGRIEFHFGTNSDLDEEFICDYCATHFKVHANINFETIYDQPKDVEHVTHFNKIKKVKLEEEQLFND